MSFIQNAINNILGAASATSLTFTSTTGLVGTITNNNAATGSVGEYISATVADTTTGLTSGVTSNITSISLTAGDWDVTGTALLGLGAATTVANWSAGISSTSVTFPSQTSGGYGTLAAAIPTGGNPAAVLVIGPARFSLASTTTIYLVGQATFSVSTAGGYGIIQARRMR